MQGAFLSLILGDEANIINKVEAGQHLRSSDHGNTLLSTPYRKGYKKQIHPIHLLESSEIMSITESKSRIYVISLK